LAKLLAGISLRLAGTNVDTHSDAYDSHDDLTFGQSILYSEGNDPARVQFFARLPIMLLTLAFGCVVFAFARDLWGSSGGLLAVAIFSVTPEILAHGHLMTTDVAVSGFLLLTMWCLWRSRHRDIRYMWFASAAMGLALSSKFSALVVVPLFLGIGLYSCWAQRDDALDRRRQIVRTLCVVAMSGVGALAVLWCCYLVIDPSLSYTKPPQSAAVFAVGFLASLANVLPVPSAFRQGLRFAIGAEAGRHGFLLGERYVGGRAAFYPVGLVIKTPIGALLLWGIGLVTAARRRRWDVWIFVVLPAVVWMAVAVTSQINIGVRHVLPVVFFASVLAGGAVSNALTIVWKSVASAALAGAALSTWIAFPNYLSYSNELFGGVSQTYRALADSNVDWGQDVHRLDDWLHDHPRPGPSYVSYFGTAPIFRYMPDALPLPPIEEALRLTSGRLVISASNYDVYASNPEELEELGDPDNIVGGSLLVWNLPIGP
jgi:hypothetical protein